MINKKKHYFAPIPARTYRDTRLGLSHHRLLGIIALHDRLDRNGSGCWASQRRLANLLGWDNGYLSRTLSELREYGCIVSSVNPKNRRLHVHLVVYEDSEDKKWDRKVDSGVNIKGSRSLTQESTSDPDSCLGSQLNVDFFEGKNGASPCDNSGNGSEAYASKHISKSLTNVSEANGAEARSRPRGLSVSEAEAYLTNCEALAASGDQLQLERPQLARIAEDAALTEAVTDRARALLGRMS